MNPNFNQKQSSILKFGFILTFKLGSSLGVQKFKCDFQKILAESFYYVNYGLSIIMSKVTQIISVMKTETLVFLLSSRQNINENAKMNFF